jgi:phosphinothricin acetyltransferase
MQNIEIRNAVINDLEAITKIYNEAIKNTTATFDTEPKSYDEQLKWFNDHNQKYFILVFLSQNNVIGWSSLSKWSDRCAYSETAEISIYIDKANRGKGIGKMLMHETLIKAKSSGIHTILARIAEGSDASIKIHETAGFKHVGIMKEVGRKFGKLLDVYLMQIIL